MYRIEQHPILPIPSRPRVAFTWKGRTLEALEGETLASALFAAGIRVFRTPREGLRRPGDLLR